MHSWPWKWELFFLYIGTITSYYADFEHVHMPSVMHFVDRIEAFIVATIIITKVFHVKFIYDVKKDAQVKTKEDASKRVRNINLFCVYTVVMTFAAIGLFLRKRNSLYSVEAYRDAVMAWHYVSPIMLFPMTYEIIVRL